MPSSFLTDFLQFITAIAMFYIKKLLGDFRCQILLTSFLLSISTEAINTASVNLQQLALALNVYSLIRRFNKPNSLVVA